MSPRLTSIMPFALAAILSLAGCSGTTDSASVSTTSGDPGEATVGIVGCSVTLDAVRGYQRVGGSLFWPAADINYGLGTVSAWAEDGSRYWEQFELSLATHSATTEIWWQLCAGSGDDTMEKALETLETIRRLAPDASIYVSAQPGYPPGHICPIAGPNGPAEMAAIADELVANHDVLPGPDMAVLDSDQLRDNCHGDLEGREAQGRILLEFADSMWR